MVLAQLVANGIISGSIISLVAASFSLIYSTNKFPHFSHGAVVATGGYLFFTFINLLSFSLWVSIFLTLIFSGVIGLIIYFGLYRQLELQGASMVILLIASIALMILIENLLLLFFGADVKSMELISTSTGINLFGANITMLQIGILITSILLFSGLFFFVKYTKLGKITRAVADNPKLAKISGVNPVKIKAASFAIGSMLAGVAGILIGLEQNLTPTMGTNLIIKGFTGAVVGGISSIPGAILGSYLLGFAENFGIWYLPSGYKSAIAFSLLLIFLLFKPKGLLGINKGARK